MSCDLAWVKRSACDKARKPSPSYEQPAVSSLGYGQTHKLNLGSVKELIEWLLVDRVFYTFTEKHPPPPNPFLKVRFTVTTKPTWPNLT